jgi:hypothetical protein
MRNRWSTVKKMRASASHIRESKCHLFSLGGSLRLELQPAIHAWLRESITCLPEDKRSGGKHLTTVRYRLRILRFLAFYSLWSKQLRRSTRHEFSLRASTRDTCMDLRSNSLSLGRRVEPRQTSFRSCAAFWNPDSSLCSIFDPAVKNSSSSQRVASY